MDKVSEYTLFQRRPKDGKHAREKMFNTIHYQGNINQIYNE